MRCASTSSPLISRRSGWSGPSAASSIYLRVGLNPMASDAFAFDEAELLEPAHLVTEFAWIHADDRGWCGARTGCGWVMEQGCENALDNLAIFLLGNAKGPIFLNIVRQTAWREQLIEQRS